MGFLSDNGVKYAFQFITISIDKYEDHQVNGRIHHHGLMHDAEFHGWVDLMMVVNQICDEIKFPRMTVGMRSFFPVKKCELDWKEEGTEEDAETDEVQEYKKGSFMTFQLLLKYRYYASWQGSVTWVDANRTYAFSSFMNLLKIMDGILGSKEPENITLDKFCRNCQIAVNSYGGSDIQGELMQTMFNYRKSFHNISELVSSMSNQMIHDADGTQSDHVKIITCESLGYRRDGGKEASFAVRILYRQHSTLQGMIYCKEIKEEKPFRSFMEMLYLMASALEANAARSAGSYSSGFVDQDKIDSVG